MLSGYGTQAMSSANYANLLEPGEKEARNPKIAAAFRRLALCEQAGTGLRMMKTQWVEQGHPEPEYVNDRGRKVEFRLSLIKSKKGPKTSKMPAINKMTGQVKLLLKVISAEPASVFELMKKLKLRHRKTFLANYLHPAIEIGIITMTNPESPRSPKQKYFITEKGMTIKNG